MKEKADCWLAADLDCSKFGTQRIVLAFTPALSILYSPLSTYWKCSAVACQTAPLAAVSTPFEPSHQDPLRSIQTRQASKIGRDWPVKSRNRRIAASCIGQLLNPRLPCRPAVRSVSSTSTAEAQMRLICSQRSEDGASAIYCW